MNRTPPRTIPTQGTFIGIVKLKLTAVFDAQHGRFTTGWSPASWGSIDELLVNLTMPRMGRDPIGACRTHGPSQSCPPTRASPRAAPEEAKR